MNIRFKLFLINYLDHRRVSRNQGFALPMAIMMGLVILVVGTTLIVRSQGDQSKVVSQAMTAKADSMAETGVTQYTNFLNNNRGLVTYPDCDGTRDSGGTCPDTGTTTKSWSLISNIYPSSAGATCTNPVSNGVPSTSTVTAMANTSNSTGWKTASDGSYKLLGYKYTPDGAANTAPGTAVLAVQGKAGESGGASESKSQIAVQFRVTANANGAPLIPQTNPGLWARNFDTSADVYANVLDSSGCTGSTQFNASIGNLPTLPVGALPNGNHTPALSSTSGVLTRQNVPFPPLPTYPSTSQFTTLVAANKVNSLANCSRTQYPATGDYDSDGVAYSSSTTAAKIYKYRITGTCTLPSNVQFGTTGKGNETIVMYIDSSLDIGNNAKVATNGSSRAKVQWMLKTASLDLGGNSQVGSSSPDASTAENWAFFLYAGTSVSMRGTPDYYAFIFAPYATADMRGNPKIAGALWVNSFQTNGAPPKIFQATTQSDLNEIFTAAYTASGDASLIPANTMAQISSYSKQAVGTSVVAVAAPSSSPTTSPTTSPSPSPSTSPSPSPSTSPSPSPSTSPTPACSVTAPSSIVFTKNGGSGTITISYTNATSLTISATASGGTISPASRTGLSGSGSTTFSVSYGNGNASGSVSFSSSCGSGTTSFTTN